MAAEQLQRSVRLVAVLLASAIWSTTASGSDCNIVCTAPAYTACSCVDADPGDPCIITTLQDDAAPGALIDCSGKDIVLRDTIRVTNGIITLRAHDLTIDGSHRIEADRTTAGVPFGMTIELTGTATITGLLDARSDSGGGAVKVTAKGDILFPQYTAGSDAILVNATGSGGSGGSVELVSGRDVLLEDAVTADGAQLGATKGGKIAIEAWRDLTSRTKLSAFGHQVSGGTIRLTARTGTLDLQACTGCFAKAEGGDPDGDGGGIFLRGTRVITSALLSAQGGYGTAGGQSTGGQVNFEAGSGGLDINADINVTGGEGGAGLDGGAIVAESEGPLTVASGVHLKTKSDANGGNGGDIRLVSLADLTITGATLDARGSWGSGNQGAGAAVEVEGCGVTVGSGTTIDARGYDGGAVVLTGREALTVSGSVDTTGIGGESGSLRLAYRRPGTCTGVSAATGCDPGHCPPKGRCSNDANRVCATNPDCTVGCQTGTCQRRCEHDPSAACTADADCHPCGSGQCVANPTTTGAQFTGAAPEYDENRNLEPCD